MTAQWADVAGQRVALPHGQSHKEFARHMTQRLLVQRNAEADAILAIDQSAARVAAWSALLGQVSSTELFEFFAYRPADVISWLAPELPAERRWSTLVEIYEACYALAARSGGDPGPAGGLPYAWRVSAGHLARTRWALLSLPFASNLRPIGDDLRRVDDDTGRLVALTRQARDDWLAILAEIDDHPLLAGRVGDIEADARDVASVRVTPAQLRLGSPGDATGADDQADPPGREATQFAVTRLLLPRFAWWTVTRSYCRLAGRLSLALSAMALLAVLISVTLFGLASIPRWSWAYTAAAVSAAFVYFFVAAGIAADARTAWPWLLRQPASAAIGILALAAFGPDWWHTAGAPGATARALLAAVILAVVSMAYLYVEAAGHGVSGRRLGRPLVVGFLGLVHSLLVSLIGLRFLLPVFAAAPQGGPALSCWYAIRSCNGQALPVPVLVALAAAWSFAAGVFLQIVWDDQPVTAPLAHVSWHRGG